MISALALTSLLAVQVPPTGQALLDQMSERAVQFFYNESHPITGFAKDRARNTGALDNFDVASVASTGFALTAMAIGAERGWITREQALNRARNTLFYLRYRAQREHGWFYHFIHWQSGVRMWNSEASSIDSAILFAGMIVAKEYFNDPQLTDNFNSIMGDVDWNWMLRDGGSNPNALTFSMGYKPESGFITSRWDIYSEQMILLLQAYGAWSACPSGLWNGPNRQIITYDSIQLLTGGPLFIHQMSHGFVNFKDKRDRNGFDFWVATKRATQANRKYCINNPRGFAAYGPNFWGLTASDGPDGYRAYGAPAWGDDDGTVAPTCVAASIDYLTSSCQNTLNSIATTYPTAWGRYGFANALNPTRNWIDQEVIGIDLGMAMCAIENRRDGLVHRMTGKNSMMQVGMRRAGLVSYKPGSEKANILKTP